MKQKIKALISKWKAFRREKLYVKPAELKAIMLTYRETVEQALGIQRDRFKNACKEFAAIRTMTRKKFVYRLEYEIDAAMLESSAGMQQAAGAIAVELAKQIIERHVKHIQDNCKHLNFPNAMCERLATACPDCGKEFSKSVIARNLKEIAADQNGVTDSEAKN